MDEEELIETVRREAPRESAAEVREVMTALLRTLGERITVGEASDVAGHLPDPLADELLDAPDAADPFSLDEFTARVSDRAGIDEDDAIVYSQAVARGISQVAADELEVAREQLPPEFDVIFEPGGPITEDEFLDTVGERAGFDSGEAARRAISAVLRTLGERLSEGEAADLALYLPEPLDEELVHADDRSATDYSYDEFTRRISRRESVETAEAEVHARAVGSALADAASDREVGAARKQLPDRFGVVFDPPSTASG